MNPHLRMFTYYLGLRPDLNPRSLNRSIIVASSSVRGSCNQCVRAGVASIDQGIPYAIFGTPSVFPFNSMLNRHYENAVGMFDLFNKILKIFKNLDQITSYLSDLLKIVCFMANSIIRRVRYFGTWTFSHLTPCSFKQFLKLVKIVIIV